MNSSQENKIIHATFGDRTPGIQKIDDIVSSHAASINGINKEHSYNIYWWRDKNPESRARDFFDTFVETREVAFLYNTEEPPRIRKIRTQDIWGYTYDISASQFIYLTALYPESIENSDEYIQRWFNQMDAKPATTYNESMHITRLPFIETMIPYYHPGEESALIEGTRDSYTCELYNHFGLVGYGLVEDYQNATILDLMIAAFDKAEISELPTTNATMEVTLIEEWETTISEIWSAIVEKVIHSSLCRLDERYKKMNPLEARRYYFKHEVIPKII